MAVDGVPFKVLGNVGSMLAVSIKANATAAQIDKISKLVQEATGQPPLVLTNNIEFVRLRRVKDEEAMKAIANSSPPAMPPPPKPAASETIG